MKILKLVLFSFLFLSASQVSGHHSAAGFDLGATTTLQGKVLRFVWRNPHSYIYVEVENETGENYVWQLEADPTPLMSRSGWTPTSLVPGDEVTFHANPDRDQERKHGLLISLTESNGNILRIRESAPGTNETATSIAGIWDAEINFPQGVVRSERKYTDAGLAAQSEFRIEDHPPSGCIAYPLPSFANLPYLNEIKIQDDRIIISSEFYFVDRTIYTDGRSHPLNGIRTNQGHSIGSWEGETLVVDTRLFSDDRSANGVGVPSGEQKHTVERYYLNEDRSQLNVDVWVEDPEFLLEPFTLSTVWHYAPHLEMERFNCDPENARLHEI